MNRGYTWDIQNQQTRKLRAAIMQCVCEEFECSEQEMKTGRQQYLSDARGVYAYFCHRLLYDTHERIARELERERSLVTRCLKRIEGFVQVRDGIVVRMTRIESKLLKTHI